ncbi:MAG: disulfide bond formation protein DsbA [Actinobacteria bacterium]|nr:disulfide bond formation protein DsbA [Actinomycetota bacterium]
MDVEFWFDPICPWTWITSRWIEEVRGSRPIGVEWHAFSLDLANDKRRPDPDDDRRLGATRRMLRVVEAARAEGEFDAVGRLYTSMGRRIHHEADLRFDIGDTLSEARLDPRLLDAADDESWDGAIRASMKQGREIAGDDVGVPIVAFRLGSGDAPVGCFGPILREVPRGEAALRLFDATVQLARVPAFSELKRARGGRPVLPSVPDPAHRP